MIKKFKKAAILASIGTASILGGKTIEGIKEHRQEQEEFVSKKKPVKNIG